MRVETCCSNNPLKQNQNGSVLGGYIKNIEIMKLLMKDFKIIC